MEKIGLYGGTFDPIHHGHLILARTAMEALGLARVLFIPNRISPHKLDWNPAPPEIRAAMIAAAVAGEPRFELDDCEIRRAGPSYTFDTVSILKEKLGPTDLYLLLGDDNISDLSAWHRINELKSAVKFVVLSREPVPISHPHIAIDRRIEISSTEIRSRAAAGASIRFLTPDPVIDIIKQHQLYKETLH